MAGAFSGHLLNTFNKGPGTDSIVTSGSMSFNACAHGAPIPPFFTPSPVSFFGNGFATISEDSATAKQIATLQAKLDKKLGPEYISQRPGPGGGPKLTYAEGWKIINLANEVFGFNGWSSSIVNLTTDFLDYNEESKRFNVGVTAIIRVTLRDGAYHEDVGYGMLENGKSKASALDKCKKEAITDALKRTLRNFGNLLGNCLYDKTYAQEVVKIKVPPVKLNKDDLYRRPEFAERAPDASTPAHPSRPAVAQVSASTVKHGEPSIKVEHESRQPETPTTHVQQHLRQDAAGTAQQVKPEPLVRVTTTPAQKTAAQPSIHASGSGLVATPPINRAAQPAAATRPNGLATPIQTPMQAQRASTSRPPLRPVAVPSPLSRVHNAPERKAVSFVQPMPMPARTDSAETADQDSTHNFGHGNDNDDDAFPLSTQEDAFFATVDLGDGDLGRPIDFEEGTGGMTTDACIHELESEIADQPPEIQPQVQDRIGVESNTGLSSGGSLRTDGRGGMLGEPAARLPHSTSNSGDPSPSTSAVKEQPQRPQSGAFATPSTSSVHAGSPAQDIKRVRTSMTSMGGFHFSPGTAQQRPQQHAHVPKPVVPAAVRTTNAYQTGQTSGLKRSADTMISASGPSTRPAAIQGMGLAQRQHQHPPNAIARRPSDLGENNESKRIKR